MKLSEFRSLLASASDLSLRFLLPDGGLIEPHAHITEVGRVDKRFIDCGGTIRHVAHCSLQAWVTDDHDHRLLPGTLAAIIDKAAPILGNDDLDVEIEYQDGLISQFPVIGAEADDAALRFFLGTKQTDCLAKDVCLPSSTADSAGCCSGTGCC